MATKDTIRDVARRLFDEKGYDHVSLRMIAAEAGITIGTMTYHYHQKQDLLGSMLGEMGAFLDALEDVPTSGEAALKRLFLLAVQIQEMHVEWSFLFQSLGTMAAELDVVRKAVCELRGRIYRLILALFAQLRRKGCMRSDLSSASYTSLASTITGIATMHSQLGDSFGDDGVARPPLAEEILYCVYPLLSPKGMALVQKI